MPGHRPASAVDGAVRDGAARHVNAAAAAARDAVGEDGAVRDGAAGHVDLAALVAVAAGNRARIDETAGHPDVGAVLFAVVVSNAAGDGAGADRPLDEADVATVVLALAAGDHAVHDKRGVVVDVEIAARVFVSVAVGLAIAEDAVRDGAAVHLDRAALVGLADVRIADDGDVLKPRTSGHAQGAI